MVPQSEEKSSEDTLEVVDFLAGTELMRLIW